VKNDYEDAKDISNAGEPLFYVATEWCLVIYSVYWISWVLAILGCQSCNDTR
jgi:hypothetical protein